MANNIETQDEVILSQLTAVTEALERIDNLVTCVNTEGVLEAWHAFYCILLPFLKTANDEHERLRVLLVQKVLPFARDMRSVRLERS